jgi:zinc transport system substrate-binding protein
MLSLIIALGITGCNIGEVSKLKENNKPVIAVSIVPQETFVKAVAGDLVEVVTLIPPGYSPANYQPTPKEMESLSKASIYFSIGVPAEKSNILPKVKDLNKNIKVVSLDEEVGKKYPHRYFGEDEEHVHHEEEEIGDKHEHEGRDPHIWLSPKRVKIMIDAIKEELTSIDPKNSDIYIKNAEEYILKLDEVDREIRETLKGVEKQHFIIYHPSFGYFADDYGLEMIAIEQNGKKATAKTIKEVIDFAKKHNIKFIFYQAEFSDEQAKAIAQEIKGEVMKINPLASNYIENMKALAATFKKVLK